MRRSARSAVAARSLTPIHHVDDGFRGKTWNRGAADVLNFDRFVAQYSSEASRLLLEGMRPLIAIRHDSDRFIDRRDRARRIEVRLVPAHRRDITGPRNVFVNTRASQSPLLQSPLYIRTVDDPGRFDERIAAVYDDYKDDPTRTEFRAEDIEATVEFLAQLAGDGHALEFGVGTGGSRSLWRCTAFRRTESTFRAP